MRGNREMYAFIVVATYGVVILTGLYFGFELRGNHRWRVVPARARALIRGALIAGLALLTGIYVVGFALNGFYGLAVSPVVAVIAGYLLTGIREQRSQ